MGALAPWHLILILLIVLVVVGTKRLTGLGKGLGESLRGFRDSVSGDGGAPARRPDLTEGSDEGAVGAKQTTPAATPEVAEAEVSAAESARREREPER